MILGRWGSDKAARVTGSECSEERMASVLPQVSCRTPSLLEHSSDLLLMGLGLLVILRSDVVPRCCSSLSPTDSGRTTKWSTSKEGMQNWGMRSGVTMTLKMPLLSCKVFSGLLLLELVQVSMVLMAPLNESCDAADSIVGESWAFSCTKAGWSLLTELSLQRLGMKRLAHLYKTKCSTSSNIRHWHGNQR